jgi:hypothetical protein
MTSHSHPHRLSPRATTRPSAASLRGAVVCLALGALLSACAGPSPQIKVLGAEQARARETTGKMLVVFVEYRLRADALFDSKGEIALARAVGAGSSTVVEIPVPLRQASAAAQVPYTLEGRLFAREDRIERFWRVAVKGALDGRAAQAAPTLHVTVAHAD